MTNIWFIMTRRNYGHNCWRVCITTISHESTRVSPKFVILAFIELWTSNGPHLSALPLCFSIICFPPAVFVVILILLLFDHWYFPKLWSRHWNMREIDFFLHILSLLTGLVISVAISRVERRVIASKRYSRRFGLLNDLGCLLFWYFTFLFSQIQSNLLYEGLFNHGGISRCLLLRLLLDLFLLLLYLRSLLLLLTPLAFGLLLL